MKWPWSKAEPVVAAPTVPPFVCLQHHPVVIVFTGDGVVQGEGGAPTVIQCDMHKHMNWHSNQFQRDDIMDPELIRRCKNIIVRDQVRRYFPTDQCRLETFDGRTLVVPPEGTNGFFVGFADTLMEAMRYVAKADESVLVKPW